MTTMLEHKQAWLRMGRVWKFKTSVLKFKIRVIVTVIHQFIYNNKPVELINKISTTFNWINFKKFNKISIKWKLLFAWKSTVTKILMLEKFKSWESF